MRKQPLPGDSQTRQFLKSKHELLMVIIQQQSPFIENLLCTGNEKKPFKFMIILSPHNSMRGVSQVVSGNQEANQFDSKTSTPNHKGVHFRYRLRRDQSLWGVFIISPAILSAWAQPVHLGLRYLGMILSPRSCCGYFFLLVIWRSFGHNGKHYCF